MFSMFKYEMGSNKNIIRFYGWREDWKMFASFGAGINVKKYAGVRVVRPEDLKKTNDRRVLSHYKNKVFVYVDYITNYSAVLECRTMEEATALCDYVKTVLDMEKAC